MYKRQALIGQLGGQGIPTVKPWDPVTLEHKLGEALAARPAAVAMDIDAAGLPFLRGQQPPAGAKDEGQLAEICAVCHDAGTPFVLKGVMTPGSAERALRAGVDALSLIHICKPEAIQERMAQGRLEKYFKEFVLCEQEFVKDSSVTIDGLAKKVSKSLGDEMCIRDRHQGPLHTRGALPSAVRNQLGGLRDAQAQGDGQPCPGRRPEERYGV